ncbi:hypothetical protein [Alicycliphilus denitrificans]|uniref:hypothetical protein n=1 Tax=Alicycliphilus denitrificans TaxID=179636 RepID=UPI0001D9EDE6|nr:hypothetical protein [Alicycliphilus denitrificans]ADU99797.1 hypothetical protein Alide_2054 [Alicycliphilus denitrificans BC]
MRRYLLIICMDDGSKGQMRGMFRNDWEAIDTILGSGLEHVAAVVARREAP